MNWFKFAQILFQVGTTAAGMFIKNENSKKTADAIIHLAGVVINGVANQNPDGTPATTAYVPPAAN